MNLDKISSNRTSDELAKYAARVKSGVDGGVEGIHDAAHNAVAAASDKIDTIRDDVKPIVDRWVSRGEDFANSAIAGTRDTGMRAKRAVSGYMSACESYVVEQPMKSVAMAAAAGAAIAALVMMSRGHYHNPDRR